MTLIAALVTVFTLIYIATGRNTIYKDKDGVQQGDGSVFSLLWIVIVYMLVWGLFPDVLPAFLINLGFWESSAILLFILFLQIFYKFFHISFKSLVSRIYGYSFLHKVFYNYILLIGYKFSIRNFFHLN